MDQSDVKNVLDARQQRLYDEIAIKTQEIAEINSLKAFYDPTEGKSEETVSTSGTASSATEKGDEETISTAESPEHEAIRNRMEPGQTYQMSTLKAELVDSGCVTASTFDRIMKGMRDSGEVSAEKQNGNKLFVTRAAPPQLRPEQIGNVHSDQSLVKDPDGKGLTLAPGPVEVSRGAM